MYFVILDYGVNVLQGFVSENFVAAGLRVSLSKELLYWLLPHALGQSQDHFSCLSLSLGGS